MLKRVSPPAKNSATASLGPLKLLFLTLSLSLFIAPAWATTPLPQGIAVGEHSSALGENSFASGQASQASGYGAIATGGNISRQEFEQEYQQYQALLQAIKDKRAQIQDTLDNITLGEQQQALLQRQEEQLNQLLQSAQHKLAQQAILNPQKLAKEQDLIQQQQALNSLNTAFNTNSFTAGNKTAYNNFYSIINALDWNKLNQANGRELLTQDLKTGMEKDLGINYTDAQYRQLIDGYLNIQGTRTFAQDDIQKRMKEQGLYSGPKRDNVEYTVRGLHDMFDNYDAVINNSVIQKGMLYEDTLTPAEMIKLMKSDYNQLDEKGKLNRTVSVMTQQYVANQFQLAQDPSHKLYKLAQSWQIVADAPSKLLNHYFSKRMLNVGSLNLTTLGSNNRFVELVYKDVYHYGILFLPAVKTPTTADKLYSNSVVNKKIEDGLIDSKEITADTLRQLEFEVQQFKNFVNNIDYSSDNWVFDKEEYRQYIDNGLTPFMEKLEELTVNVRRLENTGLTPEERDKTTAKVLELRRYIEANYQDPKLNLINFQPSEWDDSVYTVWNQAKAVVLAYQKEAKEKLLPYDPTHAIIKAAAQAVATQQSTIANQQQLVNRTQSEINNLVRQLQQYQLTSAEQLADQERQAVLQQLADKQQALADLRQALDTQRNELLGLDTNLTNSPLGTKGQNALAQGTNAFASGADSIATGTDALATGDRSIAQGYQAQATGTSSIAIGDTAKALKDRAIAIGHNAIANAVGAIAMGDGAGVGDKGVNAIAMGTNSMVNAENAIGIGTNTAVTGKDAVGIGANSTVTGERAVSLGAQNTVTGNQAVSIGSDNKVEYNNAVAVGSNITQTAENSVNLGNASAATVIPTAETAGMASYTYSPLLSAVYQFAASQPVGVVTVGAKGKERRVQNVAAGFIAPDSTDAINGSQLYSVIRAVDDGQIGLVRQDLTTGEVSIAAQRGGSVVNLTNAQGEARRLTGVADGVAPTDAVNMRQFNSQVGRLDGRIDKVEREVKGIKGSVANAIAIASMPAASLPGQRLFTVGTGHANGATALSFGLSHLNESGKVAYKLNGSASTNKSFAVGAGIGFAW